MGKLKIINPVVEFVEFVPCIKCGSEDINFYNCGYSSFNVGGAKCRNCGNKIVINGIHWGAADSDLVPYWNAKNDPKLLRMQYQIQIDELQKLINELNIID